MKKILYTIALMMCLSSIYAQLNDCTEPKMQIDIQNMILVEFETPDFTDDIWGTPLLMTDRPVFWIHGLGGEGDEATEGVEISWSQVSSSTDLNYYANSRRPDYADVSLDFAATELKGDLEDYGIGDENGLLFAHSQGGIVARKVEEYYETGALGFEPRTFGGIFTFGTPHQGARILNNRDDLVIWINETCLALTAGPIAELVTTNFWLDLLLNEVIDLPIFEDYFCGAIENNIVPFVFKDYFAGITESYQVGSEELLALNNYVPAVPVIVAYGVETEPLIWHTLIHVLPDHEPNNEITYGAFGATDDESMALWADYETNQYYTKYVLWDYEADVYNDLLSGFDLATIGCYILHICWIDVDEAYHDALTNADSWYQGFDWLISANATWKAIIGADDYVAGETWTCQCIDEHDFDLVDDYYEIEPGGECDPGWGDCIVQIAYTLYSKESDGIVLAESAGNCPGAVYVVRMQGSNHFSMRNDANTQQVLHDLFNKEYSDYYWLEPK